MNGLTLDAGGLIALERNDRRLNRLLERALKSGLPVCVPATALAQTIRTPARHAVINRFIRDTRTTVIPLDEEGAIAVGLLLAKTRTPR